MTSTIGRFMLFVKRNIAIISLLTVAVGTSCKEPTVVPNNEPPEIRLGKASTTGGPTVKAASPSSAPENVTLDVTISGTGFDQGSRYPRTLFQQTTTSQLPRRLARRELERSSSPLRRWWSSALRLGFRERTTSMNRGQSLGTGPEDVIPVYFQSYGRPMARFQTCRFPRHSAAGQRSISTELVTSSVRADRPRRRRSSAGHQGLAVTPPKFWPPSRGILKLTE